MLMDAWAQYERLGGSLSEAGKIFKIWSGNLKDSAPEVIERLASLLKGLGKQQFYEVLTAWMRSGTAQPSR